MIAAIIDRGLVDRALVDQDSLSLGRPRLSVALLSAGDFVCLPSLLGAAKPTIALILFSLIYCPPWPTIPAQSIRRFRLNYDQPCRTSVVVFSQLAEFVSEILSGLEIISRLRSGSH